VRDGTGKEGKSTVLLPLRGSVVMIDKSNDEDKYSKTLHQSNAMRLL
jgi:hypothetical protein